MTTENFAYWLRGYLELAGASGKPVELTPDQIKMINDHLNLVMTPVASTQTLPSPYPQGHPSGHINPNSLGKTTIMYDPFSESSTKYCAPGTQFIC